MLKLKVQKRKQEAKKIRAQDRIPGILYGHNIKNIPLSIDYKEFSRVYGKAGESSLIKLLHEDKELVVLIHGLQYHPVTDRCLHVDFYQVKMDEPVTTEVPLNFIGSAPVVDEQGGVLVKDMNTLEIEALPADLPSEIQVDLVKLNNLDDIIRISDLDIPEKVTVKEDENQVIVSVVLPEEEEVATEEEAEQDIDAEGAEQQEADKNRKESSEKNNSNAEGDNAKNS